MKQTLRFKKTNYQQLVIVGVLLFIMIVLSIASSEFLTVVNITNVFRQIVSVVIAGCAVTMLMVSGNFDLSIGSIMALSGTMSAILVTKGIPLVIAILLSILIGTLVGFFNGIFVVLLNIPSIIATLGTMYIASGVVWVITGGTSIHLGLGQNFTFLGRGFVGPIPFSILLAIVVFLIFYFIQNRTLLGKYTYAIGANKRTSLLSGINVNFYGVVLYVLVGTLAALSGTIMASRLGVGSASIGNGFEFDVIVAVVLGGTSLHGGEGSVFGTVIGALIVGFIANGLNLMGIHSFYQDIVKGVVLVAAVLLDLTVKSKLHKS